MKKFLIRLPSSAEKIVLAFPFFYKLLELFPKDEINLVVDEENCHIIDFLPFKMRVHSFPKEKDTLPGIHHFAYNLKDVFNIDIFFDLENTLKSAFMGVAFRAKERVGEMTGLKRFFYTQRLRLNLENNFDRVALQMLESYVKTSLSHLRIMGTPDAVLKGQLDPFLLVLVDDLKHDEGKRKLLKLFFDCFDGMNFIFWNWDISDAQEIDARTTLLTLLDKKNKYEDIKSTKNKQLEQLILACKGVITDTPWKAHLCSYYGVQALLLTDETILRKNYSHFKLSPSLFTLKSQLIRIETEKDIRTFTTLNESVDYIHQMFVL